MMGCGTNWPMVGSSGGAEDGWKPSWASVGLICAAVGMPPVCGAGAALGATDGAGAVSFTATCCCGAGCCGEGCAGGRAVAVGAGGGGGAAVVPASATAVVPLGVMAPVLVSMSASASCTGFSVSASKVLPKTPVFARFLLGAGVSLSLGAGGGGAALAATFVLLSDGSGAGGGGGGAATGSVPPRSASALYCVLERSEASDCATCCCCACVDGASGLSGIAARSGVSPLCASAS